MTGTALLDPRYNLTSVHDIHSLTAIMVYGRLTPANRQKAKTLRYRSMYSRPMKFYDYQTDVLLPHPLPREIMGLAETFAALRELAAKYTTPVLTINRRPEVSEPTAADITIEHRTPPELDFSGIEERVVAMYSAKSRRPGPLPEGERFTYFGTRTGRTSSQHPNLGFNLPKRGK
jgi:hypothetical protein